MKHAMRMGLLALHLLLALLPITAAAQVRGSDEERAILPDFMIAVPIDELPRPDAQIWLFWLTLQPGATLPSQPGPGSAMLLVEKGSVMVTGDTSITVRRRGDDGPATTLARGATDLVLSAGDGALLADNARMGLTNPGSGIAEVLMFIISSARNVNTIASMPPFQDLPGSVRLLPLSFGEALFPEGSGVLIMERHGYPQDTHAFTSTFQGVELGAIVYGSAEVYFERGSGLIWHGVFGALDIPGFPRTQPVGQGERAAIESGDGYSGQDASLHWQADEGDRMVVVRAQVVPIPFPE